MSFYVPKTQRRKGVHRIPVAKIPTKSKVGGSIKAVPFPKLPKLSMPKLPTKFTNKSKY